LQNRLAAYDKMNLVVSEADRPIVTDNKAAKGVCMQMGMHVGLLLPRAKNWLFCACLK
jgi:hypothetical protein